MSESDLEHFKELLAEAEDLCMEFTIQLRLEEQRAQREAERTFKSMEVERAERATRHHLQ
jgi:hypothetical protein